MRIESIDLLSNHLIKLFQKCKFANEVHRVRELLSLLRKLRLKLIIKLRTRRIIRLLLENQVLERQLQRIQANNEIQAGNHKSKHLLKRFTLRVLKASNSPAMI